MLALETQGINLIPELTGENVACDGPHLESQSWGDRSRPQGAPWLARFPAWRPPGQRDNLKVEQREIQMWWYGKVGEGWSEAQGHPLLCRPTTKGPGEVATGLSEWERRPWGSLPEVSWEKKCLIFQAPAASSLLHTCGSTTRVFLSYSSRVRREGLKPCVLSPCF